MQLQKLDRYMMAIAYLTADMSKCKRLQVGAVFARDGRPLATGWNGLLEGSPDDCCEETIDDITRSKDLVIHAEMNALRYMAMEGIPTKGATLYITHAPCINCAKHLAGIGLSKVIYAQDYRDSSGIDYLRTRLPIIQLKDFHESQPL